MNTIQDIAVRAVFADGFVTDFRIGSGRARGKLNAAQIRAAAERMACSRWQVENAPALQRVFSYGVWREWREGGADAVWRQPVPQMIKIDISGMPKPKAVKRAPKPVCCPQCQHSFAIAA